MIPISEHDECATDLTDEDLVNLDTGNEGYNWSMNKNIINCSTEGENTVILL